MYVPFSRWPKLFFPTQIQQHPILLKIHTFIRVFIINIILFFLLIYVSTRWNICYFSWGEKSDTLQISELNFYYSCNLFIKKQEMKREKTNFLPHSVFFPCFLISCILIVLILLLFVCFMYSYNFFLFNRIKVSVFLWKSILYKLWILRCF